MAIKVSGCRMAEVRRSKNWTWARRDQIDRQIRALGPGRSERQERRYASILKRAAPAGQSISMEAGLHAVLPQRYVVHLHSVGGIVLGLQSREKIQSFVSDSLGDQCDWRLIEPGMPGHELAQQARSVGKFQTSKPLLILLRNHGVVWAGNEGAVLRRLIRQFESRVRRQFCLRRYPRPAMRPASKRGWRKISFQAWPRIYLTLRPVFPDFAVFFNPFAKDRTDIRRRSTRVIEFQATSRASAQARKDVIVAQMLVSTLAKELHCWRAFPDRLSRTIQNLETEKARIARLSQT